MRRREFRSGFEKTIRKQLDEQKVKYKYEPCKIKWKRRVSSGECGRCGHSKVYQLCSYTPDFVLGNGIWIEAKGKLDSRNRTKLKAIREQHPEIDLRLVFQRDNIIKGTKNKTRYSEWASKLGFRFAIGSVPSAWLGDGGGD